MGLMNKVSMKRTSECVLLCFSIRLKANVVNLKRIIFQYKYSVCTLKTLPACAVLANVKRRKFQMNP